MAGGSSGRDHHHAVLIPRSFGFPSLSAPLPCTPDWQCLPDYISIGEPQPTRTGNDPDKLLRKSHFTYTATRDIRSVEGWLDVPAKPLERHHPAGAGGMAPEPPGQSLGRGWHTFATLSYDTWNNLIQTVGGQSPGGSPPRCTTIVYDTPYQHLPSIMRDFKDGCSGSALTTQSVFARGFEQVVSSVSPIGRRQRDPSRSLRTAHRALPARSRRRGGHPEARSGRDHRLQRRKACKLRRCAAHGRTRNEHPVGNPLE